MVSAVTNLGANAAKRYIEINNAKATRATEELASGLRASNPSYDPSSSAVGYSLTANIQSLGQASRNVTQAVAMIQYATGVLGAQSDILTRMKEITAASNSDTIGASQRAQMDQEFQQLSAQLGLNATGARWGGNSLFTGGAGTSTHSGAVAEAANGLNAVATAFAGTLNATSQGMITGVASAATVTASGAMYDVSIVVGGQTFRGIVNAPAAGGVLSLISTTDTGNSIALNYDAADVSGITTAATFQTHLRSLLGIGSNAATTANFASLSTNAAVATGGSMVVAAGSGTTAGTWALTYTGAAAGGTGTFKISNGTESFTQTVTTSATAMAQTVSFNNGTTVTLTNAFDGTANVAQETYAVTAGTNLTQSFQYAEKSTDVLSVTFNGSTVSALGLTGASVLDKTSAATAASKIDAALAIVATSIAGLGGKAAQLNFMTDTLMISIQNQSAARSAFIDANIADSMLTLQRFKGLGQVAGNVFTQALNEQANMTQMVQNVR